MEFCFFVRFKGGILNGRSNKSTSVEKSSLRCVETAVLWCLKRLFKANSHCFIDIFFSLLYTDIASEEKASCDRDTIRF